MRRQSPRLPAFAGGWHPAHVPPAVRLVLPIRAEGPAFERCVDALCAAWNGLPQATAYLDATAPFLENVSLLENFWVPLAWRGPITLQQIVQRALPQLPLLGWTAQDLQRLLSCRPGELSPGVTARAVLLRAVLMEPAWLLIEPGWFERPLLPADQLVALVQALLGQTRWLLLWPHSRCDALPPGVAWHTIQLEADV